MDGALSYPPLFSLPEIVGCSGIKNCDFCANLPRIMWLSPWSLYTYSVRRSRVVIFVFFLLLPSSYYAEPLFQFSACLGIA